jgi:hypothetical protein
MTDQAMLTMLQQQTRIHARVTLHSATPQIRAEARIGSEMRGRLQGALPTRVSRVAAFPHIRKSVHHPAGRELFQGGCRQPDVRATLQCCAVYLRNHHGEDAGTMVVCYVWSRMCVQCVSVPP